MADNVIPNPVPEPGVWALAAGLALVAFVAARQYPGRQGRARKVRAFLRRAMRRAGPG
jgi:hypothetical protein